MHRTALFINTVLAACLSVILVGSPAAGQCGDERIVPSDIDGLVWFGTSVDVSGDVFISSSSQSVYIFRRLGTDWVEEAKLGAFDVAAGEVLGDTVALDGDLAAISGTINDASGIVIEAVFLFRFDGINWNKEANLIASDFSDSDTFGSELDISGNVIVVGAKDNDDAGASSGSAYVFAFDGVNWKEEAKLVASDGAAEDWFGRAVAIDGDTIAVGAPRVDDTGINFGAVYVFRYDGVNWIEQVKLHSENGAESAFFGYSVAADAGRILVGAPGAFADTARTGGAHLYAFDGVNWFEEVNLKDPPILNWLDGFGIQVDLSGDYAIVESRNDIKISLFRFFSNGAGWRGRNYLIPESPTLWSDTFGYSSLAIDNSVVVTGRNFDGFDLFTGAVYLFQAFEEFDCNFNGMNDLCELNAGFAFDCNFNGIPDDCENDCNGNGIDDACDLDNATSFDCNRNGLIDDCDIGGGTSMDCDGNGVPDECETDCNENGIGDGCDLASGTSIDLNRNGLPDECERANCPAEFKVIASDGNPEDRFGESVAIDGDVAVIGAYRDDENGEDAGAAYIFRRSGDTWIQEAKLLASDGAAFNEYGISVAISNNVAMIGAPRFGATGNAPGQVYIYRQNPISGEWIEEAILQPSQPIPDNNTWFGGYQALENNLIAVGSRWITESGENAVVAYIFRYEPFTSMWVEEAILPISRIPYFGSWIPYNAMSMSNGVIVAGEPGIILTPEGRNPGTVFVYRFDTATSTWISEGTLNASDPDPEDLFGVATAVHGDVIVVGAPWNDDLGNSSGSAYVYRYNSIVGGWVEEAKLLAPDGQASDIFGAPVGIENDIILVGAMKADSGVMDSGGVYRFRFDPKTTTWIPLGMIHARFPGTRDLFGRDMAISNGGVLISATYDDIIFLNTGAAYFYEDIRQFCPAPGDVNADGRVNVFDLLAILSAWGDCLTPPPPGTPCPEDLNHDGMINVSDLLILLANWG